MYERGASFLFSRFSLIRIDLDEHFSATLIESVAAPRPVLGIIHEPALQGIGVHVAELLDFLLPAPDIEVIETLLTELWKTLDLGSKQKGSLGG